MTWIHTHAGLALDLLDPRPEQIALRDVSHALAHLCRYTGHASRFYSVAEHSVLVAEAIDREWADAAPGDRHDAVWCALMHDAHEAYLGDVASPIKAALRRLELGGSAWDGLEDAIAEAVRDRFDCHHDDAPIDAPGAIRRADLRMLATEAPHVLPWPPPRSRELPEWATPYPGVRLSFWPPDEAERRFLIAVRRYGPEEIQIEARALLADLERGMLT